MSSWIRGSVADGLDQPGTQGIQQPVGRGVHEQTEGVGPEAVVAQPVCFDSVFEVFQPVLGFAAIHVPVVDGQRVSLRVVTINRVFGPLLRTSAL